MINKVIDTIKNHNDDFGIVFNMDDFNDMYFLNMAKEVLVLINI